MGQRLGRENGAGGDRREPLMAAAGSLLRGGQCGRKGEEGGGRVGGPSSPGKKEPAEGRAKGAGYSANMGPER